MLNSHATHRVSDTQHRIMRRLGPRQGPGGFRLGPGTFGGGLEPPWEILGGPKRSIFVLFGGEFADGLMKSRNFRNG